MSKPTKLATANKRLEIIRVASNINTPVCVIDRMLSAYREWKAEQKLKSK